MSSTVLIPALLVAGYLVVCLLALLFQNRLVFFPTRQLAATPDRFDLSYRDVYFSAADGVRLHGWFFPALATVDPQVKAIHEKELVLLFCHGNAGNIADRLDSIPLFLQMGLSVFLFDYRGYGQSQGRPTESGTYADVRGAWAHLLNEEDFPADRIVLLGRSLGGAVAIELATEVRPRALIAESTFTSAIDLGARSYPWLPVRLLSRIRYDSLARIGRIRCPKLLVHSLRDEVVPFTHGMKLFQRAASPKEFLKIRGGHNDGFLVAGQKYIDGVARFLAEL